MDSVENKPISRGNPSEYGYTYSEERPKPPPEVGWKEKQQNGDHPVSLYSENVLKEGETTEAVDRESIANLSTTKQQWETIFTSNHLSQAEATQSQPKKKAAPKWEVRLPYKEKHAAPSQATSESAAQDEVALTRQQQQLAMSSSKPSDTESAIEREIRLAHEREEMLRKEKEERQKLSEKQQQSLSQGQTIIASIEAVSAESESCQPVFNELTEADRGPDNWAVDMSRFEDTQQSGGDIAETVNPNESIIEREIRLQREREEEIARLRQLSGTVTPRGSPETQQQKSQQQQPSQLQQRFASDDDLNARGLKEQEDAMKTVSYESAISNKSHEGESLIARELRELKEREEEIKNLHSAIRGTSISEDEVDGSASVESSSQPQKPPTQLGFSSPFPKTQQQQYGLSPALSPAQATWQKDVSPFVSQNRRSSVDSASSHSTNKTPSDQTPSRNVRVQPLSDGTDEDEKPDYFKKQETPIERELRLARERENELRRAKGLPEIVQKKDDDYYDSYGASPEIVSSDNDGSKSMPRSRSLGQQPANSMKKFATSRLQQELMQQKERELALRSEGKIISTSEEHIQPMKYMEVANVDRVDGKEKRNFVTKRTSVSYMEPETQISQQDVASPTVDTTSQQSSKRNSMPSGGQLFSYKEFKQTAESKIERELREMREREEELKAQRSSKSETPR